MGAAYVLGLDEIDGTQIARAGGKGAALGELGRIDGVRVPPGFCVTTDAFRRVVRGVPAIDERLERLSASDAEDRDGIRALSVELRRSVEALTVPDEVTAAITRALGRFAADTAYAVRSSATAEDLPTASFAGQQDSYLDVVGTDAVLEHVRRCWASLFTERAVAYRLRNGFDERTVEMAVVVQVMVAARAAGVLFTADPVTGHRKVASVEAVPGLGDALVSGAVNADLATVRDGLVATSPARAGAPVLTEWEVRSLADLGRRIEAHFGRPQDIEWCLDGDGVQIVQSRPITTLFPVPATGDDGNRVFVSVGHQQMMTDPMKPLGLSLFQLLALPPMYPAAGRLFVDVTRGLSSPTSRAAILAALGRSDPLTGDALQTILDRGDFVPSLPDPVPAGPPASAAPAPLDTDPAIVTELIARGEASVAALAESIATVSGPALFAFLRDDIPEAKRILFDPRSHEVFMSAMEATWWLNDHLEAWLGEKNAADVLAQSVPHNVTSEMGLALLDVADAVRPHPEVVAFLEGVGDEDFLDDLAELDGGLQAREAIEAFLRTYGMRCVGEIDITRPRWRERPLTLVPLILGNVRTFGPGAAAERFEQGRREAEAKEEELLTRLRALPDGAAKAAETKWRIDRVRTFIGYREYPKYGLVSRTFVYKRALVREAARLVGEGVLGEVEDCFHLTFAEFEELSRGRELDPGLIARREAAHRADAALTPPRVITSEGEVVRGRYRRDDLPAGALIGLPVSAGTIEGRARVLRDVAEGEVEPGDILVTAFTDPSWSPLFVALAGLVTEVGGLMTHGAVIAREYGLPAVVGVQDATRLIRDGQRIRVHGTEGYVELVS